MLLDSEASKMFPDTLSDGYPACQRIQKEVWPYSMTIIHVGVIHVVLIYISLPLSPCSSSLSGPSVFLSLSSELLSPILIPLFLSVSLR